ncbi:MAG: sensor histidine kinase [Oscillospiraceae bacterium]
MLNKLKEKWISASSRFRVGSIKNSIFISFTLSAVAAIIITGIVFYTRFSNQLDTAIQGENEILIDEVTQNINSFLRDMMRLSDSLYYSVIKNTDLSEESINDKMQLLYTANSTYVKSIVLFDIDGNAIATAPPSIIKDSVDVTKTDWYKSALKSTENLHFSTPAIQNLIEDSSNQYEWVISLSCAVELTRDKNTERGVLLIDLKYSGLSQAFRNPQLANDGYVYLIDAEGNILVHPKQQLIATGLVAENNIDASTLKDGYYTEKFGNESRTIIVRSVGYTGWKVIGVIPQKGLTFEKQANIIFVILILSLLFEFMIIINAIISSRLTDPLKKLDRSVQKMEQGLTTSIYTDGSYEVKHLGESIQSMVEQMRKLTEQMVHEHEMKQKSELDALQAQINPHFLYNTLDIIVWMIENERPDNAVKLVTSLARLFRISLSKGKNIITVADELEHVQNYLTIQLMRYKDKFDYSIEVDDRILHLSIIKLVIQPIVENAIYHSMDFMDGDGMIKITGELRDGDMYISVTDNGMGIHEDMVKRILSDYVSTGTSGSGIGLKNVNERIKLYFGDEYGVSIESELDVGTCITLHLPAIPYGQAEEKK